MCCVCFDRHRERADMGSDLEMEGALIPSSSEARC